MLDDNWVHGILHLSLKKSARHEVERVHLAGSETSLGIPVIDSGISSCTEHRWEKKGYNPAIPTLVSKAPSQQYRGHTRKRSEEQDQDGKGTAPQREAHV